ncbi:o-succinylbenzoate synthase [Terracoccus luteus]|uniref:o-succinylbenzoate synthase n=1 Tax=Terracoccus luteus TaxID=53356 RepID=A0A495Y1U7_9MICO|nr:o-succinylbenzoate synthase [Terracoccus luteus]MBB2986605.1 O-succinylbenzoate synthase [Terracoccus luteus]MCP2171806.1 O-succinylbenzoate synthase [Terracoccus luteus]RKT79355.1 O-succinylbenzoate synthase [Terracoccus luteus]
MKLTAMRLHRVDLPLVSPFTTSFSTQTVRHVMLVEVTADVDGHEVTGWGENVAMSDPLYSAEHVDGCEEVIRRWLAPTLAGVGDLTAETVGHHLRHVVGHPMAKASLEMAVLDAQLRARGQSFGEYLGGTTASVPSGVSVGIHDTVPALLDAVRGYLEEGYARIKLKIKPGWDALPVRAVRREFGDDVLLQVDANAAYGLADTATLRALDEFDLLLIEQPLAEDDLRQHAVLATRLRTPVCLDESIVSARSAADAIVMGAAQVINVKPGRVGGYLEAARIHDLARAHGIPVWCGGMLETGLGRSANAALASLPGFTLPGDISGSNRFYRDDITTPVEMHDGRVAVTTQPGVGLEPDRERLARLGATSAEVAL